MNEALFLNSANQKELDNQTQQREEKEHGFGGTAGVIVCETVKHLSCSWKE